MSVVLRGAKNAVRNPVRTVSIVLLLGVALSFALSLLLANQAVKTKITQLKASGGTTVVIRPAGSFGFQGGGDPLTTAQYDQVKDLTNVADSSTQLDVNTGRMFRVQTGPGGTSTTTSTTSTEPEANVSLESAIDTGTLGLRNFGGDNQSTTPPKIPVGVTGQSGDLDNAGKALNITSGTGLTSDTGNQALVSTTLATKNNVKVGSTFTAYGQTFTIVGLYDAGTQFGNNSVIVPLSTLQTLSTQTGEVSTIVLQADSIDHVDGVVAAAKAKLGSDKVDVTSSQQNTQDAIDSLQSVQKISLAGVFIAVGAAAVIVFMVMVMIVRERRREIAVLKAIGGSNARITLQFVTEAITLTLMAVIIGVALALATSNKLTSVLVMSNTKSSTSAAATAGGGPGGGPGGFAAAGSAGTTRGARFRSRLGIGQRTTTADLVKDVKTNIGVPFLLEGLAAVIVIGALGSAIPAFAISKVRPAEVLRGA